MSVYRRQILTFKVGARAERIYNFELSFKKNSLAPNVQM